MRSRNSLKDLPRALVLLLAALVLILSLAISHATCADERPLQPPTTPAPEVDTPTSLLGTQSGTSSDAQSNTRASAQSNLQSEDTPKREYRAPGLSNLLWSVGIVTLLFVVLICILKRFSPAGVPPLPPEAFEILGKAPLPNRQQLYVMRCGKKIFVASISQNGLDRVGEIEDEAEVDRLTRVCHGEVLGTRNPNSNGASS
ncbi:MAG: hypothetical protein Q4D38_10540 [Planctomycetia bacterium]|nr:hypothetical protein [Planctomycetia bacterium]